MSAPRFDIPGTVVYTAHEFITEHGDDTDTLLITELKSSKKARAYNADLFEAFSRTKARRGRVVDDRQRRPRRIEKTDRAWREVLADLPRDYVRESKGVSQRKAGTSAAKEESKMAYKRQHDRWREWNREHIAKLLAAGAAEGRSIDDLRLKLQAELETMLADAESELEKKGVRVTPVISSLSMESRAQPAPWVEKAIAEGSERAQKSDSAEPCGSDNTSEQRICENTEGNHNSTLRLVHVGVYQSPLEIDAEYQAARATANADLREASTDESRETAYPEPEQIE